MHYYAAAAVLASGLVASVSAGSVHALHHNLHRRGETPSAYESEATNTTAVPTCGCTTYTTTWYGEAGLVPGPSTASSSSTSIAPSTYAAPTTSEAAKPSTSSSSAPPPPPPSSTKSAEKPSSSAPAPSSYAAPSSSSVPAPPSYSAPASSSPSSPEKWAAPSWSAPSYSAPTSSWGNGNKNGGWGGSNSNSGSGSSGSGSIAPSGNKWAMTYTPYTSGGECKSASDVASDIAAIKSKGFSTVRLYATDCSGVQNVGSACKENGVNMIMGIYIDNAGLDKAREQVPQLTSWGQSNGWDHVEMVVAGNEAIFNGYCSASELADFLGEVKSSFKAAGYSGPVTTTEPVGTIQENAATICAAVDVIAANIHPFFNGGVTASGAGEFVVSQLELLKQSCGGSKEAYNLETGWPSQGDSNGQAIPGSSQQKEAVDSIVAAAGAKSAIFSFENDSWKAPGDLGVEQFWGCASLFTD